VSILPTGEQYEIVSGADRAVVTEVGATLRRYQVAGRDVVNGFAADEVVKGGRGQNLLPWPNRIRDGRYTFDGVAQQLALSEPARHNASHGLARHVPWVLVEHTGDSVTLGVRVFPQPGWPGTLEARVTYQVGPTGLAVAVEADNAGAAAFPFGYAAHPYLTVGERTVDEVSLSLPAASYLEVDERLLPTVVSSVAGSELDFRTGSVLGAAKIDTAFTDLERDADGRWRVGISLGERRTELWGDEAMTWVQVFTGGPYRTWSVAVEPMTCGPDAFNAGPTHADLIRLEPGESFATSWGIVGR